MGLGPSLEETIKEQPEDGGNSIGVYKKLASGGRFFVYLWWRLEGAEIRLSAVASVVPPSASSSRRLHSELRQILLSRVQREGLELWTEKLLTPEDFADLKSHLDELVQGWIDYFTNLGGLERFWN
jgi:hypothetical protein